MVRPSRPSSAWMIDSGFRCLLVYPRIEHCTELADQGRAHRLPTGSVIRLTHITCARTKSAKDRPLSGDWVRELGVKSVPKSGTPHPPHGHLS